MQDPTANAPASTMSRYANKTPAQADRVINEINAEIAKLEGEDWHDDDRSRRATINGLNIARRIAEKAATL